MHVHKQIRTRMHPMHAQAALTHERKQTVRTALTHTRTLHMHRYRHACMHARKLSTCTQHRTAQKRTHPAHAQAQSRMGAS
jgi:hypothetical protein